jgi:hypothetical protein
MTSISETGHAKNVANFGQLSFICTSFGPAYNPSNSMLQLPAMENALTESKNCISAIHAAQGVWSQALSTRNTAFMPFSKLVTRINNAVKASGVSKQTQEQVRTIVRKLQGRRATPRLTEEEKQAAIAAGQAVAEASSSQMSFDSRLDNFDKLIKLLASIPEYAPNESDLAIDALTALYADLYAKNTAVIEAESPLSGLRITRNNLLYGEATGIVDVAVAAKGYIKSVFGASSPQYKQVSSLRFTRYRA